MRKIADRLAESKRFDRLIDLAMNEDIPIASIPIDGIDEKLDEVQDYIRAPIHYLPIETYVNPETGETLHVFKQVYQVEEAAKLAEVGTSYQFCWIMSK